MVQLPTPVPLRVLPATVQLALLLLKLTAPVPAPPLVPSVVVPPKLMAAGVAVAVKVGWVPLVTVMLAVTSGAALWFTLSAWVAATVHVPATNRLAEICLALGQRALVGKVAMDHPESCPDYYRDASAADAVAGTRAVIDHIRALPGNDGLVQPVVTPRFIPACTDAALAGLGALAQETGCRVQSHVSESDWQHGAVLARHGISDAASLARFGLLTPGTVLAPFRKAPAFTF